MAHSMCNSVSGGTDSLFLLAELLYLSAWHLALLYLGVVEEVELDVESDEDVQPMEP